MPKEQLTDADMAEHRIAFRRPGLGTKAIRAAYIAADEKHPDMLVFKDAEHRTVYMVSRDETLDVERFERSEHVTPAEKEIFEGGFKPTSQVARDARDLGEIA
jgi:hypothetical protein